MPFVPSMPECQVAMRQLYVAPKIVEKSKENNNDRVRIRTYKDFFNKEEEPCRNIYLVGEPGTGKSTFLQHIALQWSVCHLPTIEAESCVQREHDDDFEDIDALNRIEFLFHLSLRNANEYCYYVDIIREQLLKHIYKPSEELERACSIVDNVLESTTSCIINDGLDEWNHPKQLKDGSCYCYGEEKGRTPVTHQQHFATIVTTSRPWRLAQIPPLDSKIEKRMDIEGTGDVRKLGDKIVKVLNEETGQDILFSNIENEVRKSKVYHLLTIPFLLLQVVCLYFDEGEVSNSLGKIYASVFDMLIGRKSQKNKDGRSVHRTQLHLFADKLNIRHNWTYFIEIAREAFKQILPKHGHPSVVFNSRLSSLDENAKRFALECGILNEKKTNSLSSRICHLSFTHKTMQEFFAAVYLCENKDQFEKRIVPRYQTQGANIYKTCISELSQMFIFLCGLDVQLADKMLYLMNNQLGMIGIASGGFRCTDNRKLSHQLTDLVVQGLEEADNNDFHDFSLRLRYMFFCVDNSQITCNRLIQMNQLQLVSLTLDSFTETVVTMSGLSLQQCLQLQELDLKDVALTGGLSVQQCLQLQNLTLRRVNLNEHELLLPDSLTSIDLKDVAVAGGLLLLHCSQLQHLTLSKVDLGDHGLRLPDSITSIELDRVTLPAGLVLHHCSQLQNLTLHKVDLGDNGLLLPDSITSIELDRVTLTAGLLLYYCSSLRNLTLRKIDFGVQDLLLPDSITSINLKDVTLTAGIALQPSSKLQELKLHKVKLGDIKVLVTDNIKYTTNFTVSGELSLQFCSQLQKLTFQCVKLFDHKLLLPDNITNIDMDMVTFTRGISMQHCSQLQKLTVRRVNIGDHELLLPDNLTSIDLDEVYIGGGLSLQHCSQLQELTVRSVNLGDNEMLLPDCITSIYLNEVSMSAALSLHHCSQLQTLTLLSVKLGEHEQLLPNSITSIDLYDVTLTAGLLLQHCTKLQNITLYRVKFIDQELSLPDSITSIYMNDVYISAGLSLQHCSQLQELTLLSVKLGDHELLVPDSITIIDLDDVTFTGGLSLQHCSQLQELTLQRVILDDSELLLPDSITNIDLDDVTFTGSLSLQHCSQLQKLTFSNVKIGDSELLLPDSITNTSVLDNVTFTGRL